MLTADQKSHLRHVKLDVWETGMLERVADSPEGRMKWDWTSSALTLTLNGPVAAGKTRKLIADGHLYEIYSGADTYLKLTDQGVALVDAIKRMKADVAKSPIIQAVATD